MSAAATATKPKAATAPAVTKGHEPPRKLTHADFMHHLTATNVHYKAANSNGGLGPTHACTLPIHMMFPPLTAAPHPTQGKADVGHREPTLRRSDRGKDRCGLSSIPLPRENFAWNGPVAWMVFAAAGRDPRPVGRRDRRCRAQRRITMRATMVALALFLGLTVSGASLIPSGQAHAEPIWNNGNGGGAQGGGGG